MKISDFWDTRYILLYFISRMNMDRVSGISHLGGRDRGLKNTMDPICNVKNGPTPSPFLKQNFSLLNSYVWKGATQKNATIKITVCLLNSCFSCTKIKHIHNPQRQPLFISCIYKQ